MGIKQGLMIAALSLVSACVSTVPFPSATQNGSSVVMSLGSRILQSRVKVPRKSEFSVAVTDVNGDRQAVSIRMMFPIVPDPTSPISDRISGIDFLMMTVDMVDPATGLPTTFAPGASVLTVTNTQGIEALNDLDLPLNILPGEGVASPLASKYTNDEHLEYELTPRQQWRISFSNPAADVAADQALGGISVVFRYAADKAAEAELALLPKPVALAAGNNLNFSYHSKNEGGEMKLTVDIINPYGIASVNMDRTERPQEEQQMSSFQALDFSVVLDAGLPALSLDDIVLESVTYFDRQGQQITPNVELSMLK